MKLPYKSSSPKTGVVTYEIVDSAIILEFKDGKYRYAYNATKPGAIHVAAMMERDCRYGFEHLPQPACPRELRRQAPADFIAR